MEVKPALVPPVKCKIHDLHAILHEMYHVECIICLAFCLLWLARCEGNEHSFDESPDILMERDRFRGVNSFALDGFLNPL